MGTDLDQFVHPERISSQLICPICTQVLKNPVQTATEHLFCEEELLEWMTRSNLCPITKTVLDPRAIKKPGRIVLNMLGELEIYCSNKPHGCQWSGPQEQLSKHLSECSCKSRERLVKELADRQEELETLQRAYDALEIKYDEAVAQNLLLQDQIEECQHRLRVYSALAASSDQGSGSHRDGSDDGGSRRKEHVVSDDEDSRPAADRRSRQQQHHSPQHSKDRVREKDKDGEHKATSDAERLRGLRALKTLQSDDDGGQSSPDGAAFSDRHPRTSSHK